MSFIKKMTISLLHGFNIICGFQVSVWIRLYSKTNQIDQTAFFFKKIIFYLAFFYFFICLIIFIWCYFPSSKKYLKL